MNSWLVSSKPSYFDAVKAFKENELVDWGNGSNNKIEVGDIVYIYITENIREIKIKTEVTKINLTYDEIFNNDEEYYNGEEEKRLNNPANNFFRLKRLKIYEDEVSKKLSLDILRTIGLKNVQGKTRISKKLIDYIAQIENHQIESKNEIKIKNIILYGAPGVGKTHNYQRLIGMIEEGRSQSEIFQSISDNEEVTQDSEAFKVIKNDKRVEFVTFHQSYSYEDFIEGFRPNEDGKIKLEDGIFKHISDNAKENLQDSKKSKKEVEDKQTFSNLIEEFKLYVEDKMSSAEEFILKGKATIMDVGSSSFLVGGSVSSGQKLTFHIIERDYENFKKGLIKSYKDIKSTFESKSGIHGNAPYYFALYEKLQEFEDTVFDKSHIQSGEKIQKKNYYIVIDEINRGNISKIFGELITLIEEDKRDVYEVTLPYSKEKFSVPSNLHIIATMNSTDKSIATVDIALRRRFTFLKMQPKPELVKHQEAKELMEKLNEHIENILGEDYKLGHSYFMKIVDAQDLEFVKEYKIKPLLEEYFYADEKAYIDALEILKTEEYSDE